MRREAYLKECNISVVCQIYKNKRGGPANYRGVSSLSLVRKTFSNILEAILSSWLMKIR
jgi:hypothetical protein